MATVNKNFRIKQGLIVEGTTGTINGDNILTENGGDTYILNLVGGATLVKSVDTGTFTVDGAGNLTINSGVFDASGAAGTAESNAKSYADGLASNYDAAGAAGTAESNAKSYADGLASNYDPAGAAGTAESNAKSYADGLASNYDPAGAAGTAESNAKSYADGLASNYDPAGAAAQALSDANTYTDNAVAGLAWKSAVNLKSDSNINVASSVEGLVIDGHPALTTSNVGYGILLTGQTDSAQNGIWETFAGDGTLYIHRRADGDTNDELIGAAVYVQEGTQYGSTSWVQSNHYITAFAGQNWTQFSGQGSVTAGSGITVDGLEVSINRTTVDSWYDAAGAAGTAESNAKSYADGLASNYDPAGAAGTAESNANSYTDGYVGAVLDGTETFTAINLNSVSMQKAVQANIASIVTNLPVMSWVKTDYPTAKLWVKFATSTHSQISEVLLTTDSSNNIAITEFAEVGTNGSLGTVTAVYNAGNIEISVDTVYANTEATAVATLIK